MAEKRKELTAKGRFRVREGAAPIPHEEGFRHALDDALKRIGWPAGDYRGARIELNAHVEVVNPGHIVEYGVTIRHP